MAQLKMEIKATEIEDVAKFLKDLHNALQSDNVCGDRSSWIDKYDEIVDVYNEFAEKHGIEKIDC